MEERDLPAIHRLNESEVPNVDSRSIEQLRALLGWAEYALVADDHGTIAGFVMTIRPQQPYGSHNYAWFAERYRNAQYLDRVAVDANYRRQGVGTALYRAIEGHLPVALEVNIKPPNDVSLAFHRARGYQIVGELAQPSGIVCAMHLKAAPTATERECGGDTAKSEPGR